MTVQLQQVGVQYWFRVLLTALFCISSVWFGIYQSYGWLGVSLCLLVLSILWQIRLYRLHTKQVLFMIDALENNDNTFHFTEENGTPESKEINRALNRVGHILYSVKAETAQQEKYWYNQDYRHNGKMVCYKPEHSTHHIAKHRAEHH